MPNYKITNDVNSDVLLCRKINGFSRANGISEWDHSLFGIMSHIDFSDSEDEVIIKADNSEIAVRGYWHYKKAITERRFEEFLIANNVEEIYEPDQDILNASMSLSEIKTNNEEIKKYLVYPFVVSYRILVNGEFAFWVTDEYIWYLNAEDGNKIISILWQ